MIGFREPAAEENTRLGQRAQAGSRVPDYATHLVAGLLGKHQVGHQLAQKNRKRT